VTSQLVSARAGLEVDQPDVVRRRGHGNQCRRRLRHLVAKHQLVDIKLFGDFERIRIPDQQTLVHATGSEESAVTRIPLNGLHALKVTVSLQRRCCWSSRALRSSRGKLIRYLRRRNRFDVTDESRRSPRHSGKVCEVVNVEAAV